MVALTVSCSACDQPVGAEAGQRVRGDMLTWYMAYRCPHCGNSLAADSSDLLTPPNVREALLQQGGVWLLIVTEIAAPAAPFWEEVRRTLGLTLPDLAQLKKQMPGVLYIGTQAESMWLMGRLMLPMVKLAISREEYPGAATPATPSS
jgi:hypothetical protein